MSFNFTFEDIKYIKFVYEDTHKNPCVLKAGVRSMEKKHLIGCIKYDDNLFIPTPQEVTMGIVCLDGLYKTKTNLLYIDYSNPFTILTFDLPKSVEYQQNREYFRVGLVFSCLYIIHTDEGEKRFKAMTDDISANGVSIILPLHIISDADSELIININGKTVHTKVRYVRSEKLEEGYKISFTYSDIGEHDRDLISQVCIQRQLEERRDAMLRSAESDY